MDKGKIQALAEVKTFIDEASTKAAGLKARIETLNEKLTDTDTAFQTNLELVDVDTNHKQPSLESGKIIDFPSEN